MTGGIFTTCRTRPKGALRGTHQNHDAEQPVNTPRRPDAPALELRVRVNRATGLMEAVAMGG